MRLLIPGPTMCPPQALLASSRQMINHRSNNFGDMLHRITENLKKVYATENDVLLLTASGTGGMEAAIVNFLSPGDLVLATSIGVFGERFAQIAQQCGAHVHVISAPYGEVMRPADLEKTLQSLSAVKAILITHNETSTGAINDLEALARVARMHGVLLIVDAISSLGAIPVKTDAWGLDVVVGASQKGLMAPPGIATISVSPRAWGAYKTARMPRFYFDLTKAKESLDAGVTSWTPALSVLYALDMTLELIHKEGLEQIYTRHERLARRLRGGLKTLGLKLLAQELHASPVVTAIKVPAGLSAKEITHVLELQYNIIIAGGQRELSGKIIRIGHVGYVNEQDIDAVLAALKVVCNPSQERST